MIILQIKNKFSSFFHQEASRPPSSGKTDAKSSEPDKADETDRWSRDQIHRRVSWNFALNVTQWEGILKSKLSSAMFQCILRFSFYKKFLSQPNLIKIFHYHSRIS